MRLRAWGQRWLVPLEYWSSTRLLRITAWTIGRWEVRGRDHVPASGAFIVVSNHLNNADPPVLAAGIARRRVRFMAKIELFKLPFGAIVRGFGAIPVRRFDADLSAMLVATRVLRDGGVLGMFPEGTRSRTGRMGRMHPGTALLAYRTGSRLLPCALTGTENLMRPGTYFRRPRLTVTIGEPIEVETKRRPTAEEIEALTAQIGEAIAALLPPSYRPSYTGSEGEAPGE